MRLGFHIVGLGVNVDAVIRRHLRYAPLFGRRPGLDGGAGEEDVENGASCINGGRQKEDVLPLLR